MPTAAFREAQASVLDRYGMKAEERFVDAPTVKGRAHVLVVGQGRPVVLVSGIGTPAAMWAPLMTQLNGLALHAVDLPGFGLTDAGADLTEDFRSSAVGFLGDVLRGLELERPSIVANSLGSLWSSWLALDRPDRVHALVHVGCPALVLGTSAPLPMRLLSVPGVRRVLMKLDPPSARQVERLAKMVEEHPLPPEIADALLATERMPSFEATFLGMLSTLLRLRGARADMALTADHLARIDHPSLLIFGAKDPFGAAQVGERMADAMPNARLHVVEGGHAPWLHHAEEIGPLVTEFLRADLS